MELDFTVFTTSSTDFEKSDFLFEGMESSIEVSISALSLVSAFPLPNSAAISGSKESDI